MKPLIFSILYLLFAPILGGLLAGADRIVTARMQRRVGPPILQPFYDVLKLFTKENFVVRRSQNFFLVFFFIFVIFSGVLFFSGGDMLLVIFALTLANIFFVLGAYKASSPYSVIGAERELLQMMSYEPMVILVAVAVYLVTGSFFIEDIFYAESSLIWTMPGVFIGLIYILTIKFRKSPFDLATSHHAHQEIVKGITTEFSGKMLGMIEIAHWYENIFLLGFIYIFFAKSPILAIFITLLVYFFEVLIDNTFARLKWQFMMKNAWLVTLIFGFLNIVIYSFLK